jgi:Ca2+/Na+ antiporter
MVIVGYVFLGLIAVAVVIGAVLFVTALPEIARYLRIRRM